MTVQKKTQSKISKHVLLVAMSIVTLMSLMFVQVVLYQSVNDEYERHTAELKELKEEIESLYILNVIQGRQIQTLFNVELRNLNPAIKERMERIREEFDSLDQENKEEVKHEEINEIPDYYDDLNPRVRSAV